MILNQPDAETTPIEAHVERSILVLRGHRVMLDETLAALYGVPARTLNQAVKRNIERFPEDFMFQMTEDESARLRSQIVTLEPAGRGQHRKYRAYAFTEQGVAMLSSVLRSTRAVRGDLELEREDGRAEGREEGLRGAVEQLCLALDVELTAERRETLRGAPIEELEALLRRIGVARAWPE